MSRVGLLGSLWLLGTRVAFVVQAVRLWYERCVCGTKAVFWGGAEWDAVMGVRNLTALSSIFDESSAHEEQTAQRTGHIL